MEGYIAEVRLFAGNFAPRGWAFCNGQILSIAQNTALFSLLGVTYGGNGQTTFALPDLRGRTAVSPGQGPGLSNINLGQVGGTEQVTLLQSQMPLHTHQAMSDPNTAGEASPVGHVWAAEAAGATAVYSTGAPTAAMNPAAIAMAGGNQPFNNRNPYLGLNYIICMEGIFPSRN